MNYFENKMRIEKEVLDDFRKHGYRKPRNSSKEDDFLFLRRKQYNFPVVFEIDKKTYSFSKYIVINSRCGLVDPFSINLEELCLLYELFKIWELQKNEKKKEKEIKK